MTSSSGPAIWARWGPVALAIGVAFLLGWWIRGGGGDSEQEIDAPEVPSSRPPELRLDPKDVTLLPGESLRWDYEGAETPEALQPGAGGENSGMDTPEERR